MKHGSVWPGAPPVKAPGLLFFRDFLEGHLIRHRGTAVPVLHTHLHPLSFRVDTGTGDEAYAVGLSCASCYRFARVPGFAVKNLIVQG